MARRAPRRHISGSLQLGRGLRDKKSSSPGTKGYAEQQPRHNDGREMPDAHTPREHQNKPQQKPRPSHR